MGGLTFVYVAIGGRYVQEALQAAAKCRSVMPGCRTLLYTDAAVQDPAIDRVLPAAPAGEDPFLLKIRGMRAVEEERFVFLDTDTWVVADISELDRLLDGFDLAAAHAPVRLQSNLWPETRAFLAGVPECFPEYNTGVIAMRRSAALDAMLGRWEEIYLEQTRRPPGPRTQDQASFRRALYESRLRFATLPTEYNCRFPYPASVCGTVKILHGHGAAAALERLAERVNRQRGFRVILQERFRQNVVLLGSGRTPGVTPAAGPARQG